jgi:Enoyl-(Acyl carrier protein) reductase
MGAEVRPAELGFTVPNVVSPLAACVRTGDLVNTAGQLPASDGEMIAVGKLGGAATVIRETHTGAASTLIQDAGDHGRLRGHEGGPAHRDPGGCSGAGSQGGAGQLRQPRPTATDFFTVAGLDEQIQQEVGAQILAQIPLGRFGLPEEIAAAVAFLLYDEAAFITGAELVMTGGMP